MTKYYKHVTTKNERWDTIAYTYYGNPYGYLPIIQENPNIAITPVLPDGIAVYVPIFDNLENTYTKDLPPWKQ